MSGHSRWSNIKNKKAAADAKKGKHFTKLAKEIMVSAKLGGSDVSANPRLRAAVQKAREYNLPKDNIEKAIKKGAGELEGVDFEEITYEGYGAHGVAFILEVMTDKKTRTVPELKNIFSKFGGSLAETGAVGFLFEHIGIIMIETPAPITEEELLDVIIEIGAEDYEKNSDTQFTIKTLKENFHHCIEALRPVAESREWKIADSGLSYEPKTQIDLESDEIKGNLSLIEALENHDDVQNIYHNLNLPDET